MSVPLPPILVSSTVAIEIVNQHAMPDDIDGPALLQKRVARFLVVNSDQPHRRKNQDTFARRRIIQTQARHQIIEVILQVRLLGSAKITEVNRTILRMCTEPCTDLLEGLPPIEIAVIDRKMR